MPLFTGQDIRDYEPGGCAVIEQPSEPAAAPISTHRVSQRSAPFRVACNPSVRFRIQRDAFSEELAMETFLQTLSGLSADTVAQILAEYFASYWSGHSNVWGLFVVYGLVIGNNLRLYGDFCCKGRNSTETVIL
ncbi:hypothetical protein FRB91_008506 [Serendipita sp. 411]|nr:hypothetical protein FRB91_008506 [Serendipita sp. 411]